jgi:hypothetical protein
VNTVSEKATFSNKVNFQSTKLYILLPSDINVFVCAKVYMKYYFASNYIVEKLVSFIFIDFLYIYYILSCSYTSCSYITMCNTEHILQNFVGRHGSCKIVIPTVIHIIQIVGRAQLLRVYSMPTSLD